jgi:hypothetical protein
MSDNDFEGYGSKVYIPDEWDMDDVLEQLEVAFADIISDLTSKRVCDLSIVILDKEDVMEWDFPEETSGLKRGDFMLPNQVVVTFYLHEDPFCPSKGSWCRPRTFRRSARLKELAEKKDMRDG